MPASLYLALMQAFYSYDCGILAASRCRKVSFVHSVTRRRSLGQDVS